MWRCRWAEFYFRLFINYLHILLVYIYHTLLIMSVISWFKSAWVADIDLFWYHFFFGSFNFWFGYYIGVGSSRRKIIRECGFCWDWIGFYFFDWAFFEYFRFYLTVFHPFIWNRFKLLVSNWFPFLSRFRLWKLIPHWSCLLHGTYTAHMISLIFSAVKYYYFW